MNYRRLKLFTFAVFVVSGFVFLTFQTYQSVKPGLSIASISYGYILPLKPELFDLRVSKDKYEKIYFVGDIMLGRHVEFMMSKHGNSYPYNKFKFDDSSYVMGNFEASIPLSHKPTPNLGLKFSVDDKYISSLKSAGFTHLSLANNHSLDFGKKGYLNTKDVLNTNGLMAVGHPTILSTSSIALMEVSGHMVSVITVHTLFGKPTDLQISSVLEYATVNSDFQIIYVHWGDEYKQISKKSDRKFAKKLVDYGADLIIGHHPHVVQNIEEIEGVPVIYSLGNFIFDQFFSSEVQEGLVVELGVDNGLVLNLIPITSKSSKAQPQQMNDEESKKFLNNLTAISSDSFREGIMKGEISIENKLASSSETAIMAK